MMFCNGCNSEKDDKDFMLGHKECYKCIYKKKMREKDDKIRRKCKICNLPIYQKFKLAYCSEECAKIGTKKSNQENWAKDYYSTADRKFNFI